MRWAAVGVLVVVALSVGAYSLVVPPTSGAGWALDDTTAVHMPVMRDEPGVVLYQTDAGDQLLVVNVYGGSSCPPRVRGVAVRAGSVHVSIGRRFLDSLGSCTADAGMHWFSIRVDRERVAGPSLRVVVDAEDNMDLVESFDINP